MIRWVLQVLAVWALVVVWPAAAFADNGVIDVDEKTNALDLALARNPMVADQPQVKATGPGDKEPTALKAVGLGPKYYWNFYSFHNSSGRSLNLSLAIEPQRFPGSGIFSVKPLGEDALSAQLSNGGGQVLALVNANGMQTVPFRVAPGEYANLAIEAQGPEFHASLWRTDALSAKSSVGTWLEGVAEGALFLVTAVLVAIIFWKPSRASAAALGLGLAALLFVGFENGAFTFLPVMSIAGQHYLRLIIEAIFAGSLALCGIGLGGYRIMRSGWGIGFAGIIAAVAVALGYGLAQPLVGTAAIRIFLPVILIAGLVSSLMGGGTERKPDRAFVFWIVALCWLISAGAIALGYSSGPVQGAMLAASTAIMVFSLMLLLGRDVLLAEESSTKRTRRSSLRESEKSENAAKGRFETPTEAAPVAAPLWPAKPAALPAQVSPAVLAPPLPTQTPVTPQKSVALPVPLGAVPHLLSRESFLAEAARLLQRPDVGPVRFVVIDLDRFKTFNEGLGRVTGDHILHTVTERLLGHADDGELVARLGGGTFAMMCQENPEDPGFIGHSASLQTIIGQPIKLEYRSMVLTTSLGVSSEGLPGESNAEHLLEQANVAMLEARGQGGNSVVFHHQDMKDDRAQLLTLEADLRTALKNGAIEIFYQPIVELATLEIKGFEALARWRHPELGLLSPAEFIEIAETAGMMQEIGQFMMVGGARQLGIWQRVHMRGRRIFVSVNVSPSQLLDPAFVARVKLAIDREALEPGSFVLEITETTVMRRPEQSAALLRQLKAQGVGLACDDFGSGFSGLASLRDFPFDTLKLDKTFAGPEAFNPRNERIISSITELAASLGMTVVAEGIETQEQIDKLAALGCALGQGFLIGEPEPVEVISQKLAEHVLARKREATMFSEQVLPSLAPPAPIAALPSPEENLPQVPKRFRSLYEPQTGFEVPQKDADKLLEPGPARYVEELPSIFIVAPRKVAPRAKAKAPAKRGAPKRKVAKSRGKKR